MNIRNKMKTLVASIVRTVLVDAFEKRISPEDAVDKLADLVLMASEEAPETESCRACGWGKSRDPAKDEEPPIVRGALDAQERAEIEARAAKAAARILGEAFGCEHKGNNVDWRSVAIDIQQVLPGKIG